MRPLTEHTPKPLLKVGDKTLLEHQLEKLIQIGIKEVVINVAYLGEKIIRHLGDGDSLGIKIEYSVEPYPLETAGALHKAMPLLGEAPFLLLNGDVWHDYPLGELIDTALSAGSLGRLIFVPNPSHNHAGDFWLDENGIVGKGEQGAQKSKDNSYERPITVTYSGLSLLSPRLINDYPCCRDAFPLREVFAWAIEQRLLEGALHTGAWIDIGTPERLESLREAIAT